MAQGMTRLTYSVRPGQVTLKSHVFGGVHKTVPLRRNLDRNGCKFTNENEQRSGTDFLPKGLSFTGIG